MVVVVVEVDMMNARGKRRRNSGLAIGPPFASVYYHFFILGLANTPRGHPFSSSGQRGQIGVEHRLPQLLTRIGSHVNIYT